MQHEIVFHSVMIYVRKASKLETTRWCDHIIWNISPI